ncbi:MAG: hypothetical protein HY287_11540 [Planctomycetes bacterium]|nr:hypothetical protein [Planctomycetota bacterium]MBI3834953.1 hypothetical protein [Planctomycetota bacterium]
MIQRTKIIFLTRKRLLESVVAVGMLLLPGCRDKAEGPAVFPLEGKVEKVELNSPDNSGKITVSYYNEKQRQEVSGTALLTHDTEVMINGAVGTLRDIRQGEKIRGEVRIDKKGGERIQTVLKIRIDRPKTEPNSGG